MCGVWVEAGPIFVGEVVVGSDEEDEEDYWAMGNEESRYLWFMIERHFFCMHG